MRLNGYQAAAVKTAIYPSAHAVVYPALGLAGEAGEVANKIKKILRDGSVTPFEELKSEMGDVLWYLAVLADDLGISLEDVALTNIAKLADRKSRGALGGSGDHR